MKTTRQVLVIGAGAAGSAAATVLAQAAGEVEVVVVGESCPGDIAAG